MSDNFFNLEVDNIKNSADLSFILMKNIEDSLLSDKLCPYCKSDNYVKYGKTSIGRQRFLCNNCEKTFTLSTNTVFSNSKLEPSIWIKAIKCLDSGMTLRKMSSELGISLKTCQNLKKKINEIKKDGEIIGK